VCQSGESQQRWLNQESPAFRRGECQRPMLLEKFLHKGCPGGIILPPDDHAEEL
jgi:hypothetical protein